MTMKILIAAALVGLGPTAMIHAGATETEAAEWLSAFFVAFLAARIWMTFWARQVLTPYFL